MLLINSAILSVNFFIFTFRKNFLWLFHVFQKRKILLISMKNQHYLVLKYVLVNLSIFEKTLQTTNSKLTNEKTNYNKLSLLTTTNDNRLRQEMTTYNKKGNNNHLQRTENIFKYAQNNQKYHKTKLLTLQKSNYKFKTTKQQLNC